MSGCLEYEYSRQLAVRLSGSIAVVQKSINFIIPRRKYDIESILPFDFLTSSYMFHERVERRYGRREAWRDVEVVG